MIQKQLFFKVFFLKKFKNESMIGESEDPYAFGGHYDRDHVLAMYDHFSEPL